MNRITPFEGQEIVNRANFNSRIAEMNQVVEAVEYNQNGVNAHHLRLDDHESRIKRLEDGLFRGMGKYTYLISFADLDGIQLIHGNWNRENQRLEC